MQNVNNTVNWEAREGIWELSVLPAQFFCTPRTAQKNKLIRKEKWVGGEQKEFTVLDTKGEGKREGWDKVLWVNGTDTKSGIRIAGIKPFNV